jgi:hypothetical protein
MWSACFFVVFSEFKKFSRRLNFSFASNYRHVCLIFQ